jgi:hypothetical protein
MILSDGNLITKNLGNSANQPCLFSVLEPENLNTVCEIKIEASCMGRFSSDLTAQGEFIYFSSEECILRMCYDHEGNGHGQLVLDSEWSAPYRIPGSDQSAGWDTTIGSGSVWMMDQGRPWGWPGYKVSSAPQRAFRFSLDDPSDCDVLDVIGTPNAFNPGPPLYDPERQILVHYDTVVSTLV